MQWKGMKSYVKTFIRVLFEEMLRYLVQRLFWVFSPAKWPFIFPSLNFQLQFIKKSVLVAWWLVKHGLLQWLLLCIREGKMVAHLFICFFCFRIVDYSVLLFGILVFNLPMYWLFSGISVGCEQDKDLSVKFGFIDCIMVVTSSMDERTMYRAIK